MTGSNPKLDRSTGYSWVGCVAANVLTMPLVVIAIVASTLLWMFVAAFLLGVAFGVSPIRPERLLDPWVVAGIAGLAWLLVLLGALFGRGWVRFRRDAALAAVASMPALFAVIIFVSTRVAFW